MENRKVFPSVSNPNGILKTSSFNATMSSTFHIFSSGASPIISIFFVGEGGQNISGGQKQRIAIARALLSDTEVVIFDEATSNLDQLTEKKIYDNLRSTNKTQIIITHRLSSIRDTDYIYVLNRGSIIEQGTHLDLMKKKGWYFESIQ